MQHYYSEIDQTLIMFSSVSYIVSFHLVFFLTFALVLILIFMLETFVKCLVIIGSSLICKRIRDRDFCVHELDLCSDHLGYVQILWFFSFQSHDRACCL